MWCGLSGLQVGVLEDMAKSLVVMECLMPEYMGGLASLTQLNKVTILLLLLTYIVSSSCMLLSHIKEIIQK